ERGQVHDEVVLVRQREPDFTQLRGRGQHRAAHPVQGLLQRVARRLGERTGQRGEGGREGGTPVGVRDAEPPRRADRGGQHGGVGRLPGRVLVPRETPEL